METAAPLRFPAKLRDLIRRGDTRFVVTGAGGWLGRATLEMLDEALGDELPSRVHAYGASTRWHRLRSGRDIQLSALADLKTLRPGPAPTVVAHYAFLTREKLGAMPASSFVEANRWITRFTIENAARLEAVAAFSTSSGAVYRRDRSLETNLAENPYGALKREEEEAFAAWGERAGRRSVVCRVFNLSGPFLNKDYALGSLIEDALAGRALRVRAPHRVVRSYVHVREVVTIGFASMLGIVTAPHAPFDTGGGEGIEVGELAVRVQRVLGRPELSLERPALGEGPEDRYVGNGAVFRSLCTSTGRALATLDEGIRDTAAYLSDTGTRAGAQPATDHVQVVPA